MGGQDIILSFERSVLSKLAPQLINLTYFTLSSVHSATSPPVPAPQCHPHSTCISDTPNHGAWRLPFSFFFYSSLMMYNPASSLPPLMSKTLPALSSHPTIADPNTFLRAHQN